MDERSEETILTSKTLRIVLYSCALTFVFLLLSFDAAYSDEGYDFIAPCHYNLMPQVFKEYISALDKLFSCEQPCKMIRVVIGPSFSEESVVMVYEDDNKTVRVELVRPEKSVWYAVSRNYEAMYNPEFKSIPLESIRMTTSSRNLSSNTFEALQDVWGIMIDNARIPIMREETHVTYLDGTMFFLSSGDGQCAFTSPMLEGSRVDSLIEIGQKLEKFATSEKTDVSEDEILTLTNMLLKQLRTEAHTLQQIQP